MLGYRIYPLPLQATLPYNPLRKFVSHHNKACHEIVGETTMSHPCDIVFYIIEIN